MKHKAINNTPIGEIIRKRLEDKGMTQVELSRLTRMTTPVMNDIIQGRRGISPKQIISLALILGLDAIELGRMQSDQKIMAIINPMIQEEEQ